MSEKLNSHNNGLETTEWDMLKENKGNDFDAEMKEIIAEEGGDYFNSLVNCGGFALEIFACVFSGSRNIDEAVKNIIETFPFVRVDDGTELEENEYRVLYRHTEGGLGHHFIKEVDGQFLEKDGREPVRKFEKWGIQLEDAPEVKLVVNKNHEFKPRDEEGELIYSYII